MPRCFNNYCSIIGRRKIPFYSVCVQCGNSRRKRFQNGSNLTSCTWKHSTTRMMRFLCCRWLKLFLTLSRLTSKSSNTLPKTLSKKSGNSIKKLEIDFKQKYFACVTKQFFCDATSSFHVSLPGTRCC